MPEKQGIPAELLKQASFNIKIFYPASNSKEDIKKMEDEINEFLKELSDKKSFPQSTNISIVDDKPCIYIWYWEKKNTPDIKTIGNH